MKELPRPRLHLGLACAGLLALSLFPSTAPAGISVQVIAHSGSPSLGVFLSDGVTRLDAGATFDFGFFDEGAFNGLNTSERLDYSVLTGGGGAFDVLGSTHFSGGSAIGSHTISLPGDPDLTDERLFALIFDPVANEIGLFGSDLITGSGPETKYLWSVFSVPGTTIMSAGQANQFFLGSGPATVGSGPLLLTSAIPEPSTALSFLGLLIGLVLTVRRRGRRPVAR